MRKIDAKSQAILDDPGMPESVKNIVRKNLREGMPNPQLKLPIEGNAPEQKPDQLESKQIDDTIWEMLDNPEIVEPILKDPNTSGKVKDFLRRGVAIKTLGKKIEDEMAQEIENLHLKNPLNIKQHIELSERLRSYSILLLILLSFIPTTWLPFNAYIVLKTFISTMLFYNIYVFVRVYKRYVEEGLDKVAIGSIVFFGIMAIVFNPIFPLHFGELWPFVDWIAAIGLIISAFNELNLKLFGMQSNDLFK